MACLPLQEKIGWNWNKLYGHQENMGKQPRVQKNICLEARKIQIWHENIFRSRGNAPWSQRVFPRPSPTWANISHIQVMKLLMDTISVFHPKRLNAKWLKCKEKSHMSQNWGFQLIYAYLYDFKVIMSFCLCICESCQQQGYLHFTPFCQVGHQLFTGLPFLVKK